ncbi:RDD family protein [Metamycoplasma buccale]|uniref:RDD family protein n=1 Tax=Metamycoplasma buccale TaxID=55602 RepID=UPI00398E933E
MIKINKKANFWIRLLATIIDAILFIIFLVATSFAVFNYKTGQYFHEANYYVWLFLLILYLIFFFIVLPIIWNGKTIGMRICKIKIIKKNEKDKFSKVIFDRQRLFSFLWIIVFLSFIIFISPKTFIEAANINKNLNKVQKIFLTIPTVLSSLSVFLQAFLIITNAKENRIGLNDKFSASYTVWINKYEEIEQEEKVNIKIKPIKRTLPNIKIEN